MQCDPSKYGKPSSGLIRETELFLSSVVRNMDWSREDEDVVMDIGCGPGYSTRTMLLPVFPMVQKVLALDVTPELIRFAKSNNSHGKIEYHVADIEKIQTIEKWAEGISKVTSIYCFHWLGNQREAFQNIYHVLRPGGEAALLFWLTSCLWDSYPEHLENPKWSKYLQNANQRVPESYFKKHGASHYRNMLKEIGFNVVICEEKESNSSYLSDEECRNIVYARCALSSYIPQELKEEFKEYLFQSFLKRNGRDSDGRPRNHYTTLSLLLQKPEA